MAHAKTSIPRQYARVVALLFAWTYMLRVRDISSASAQEADGFKEQFHHDFRGRPMPGN